MTTSEYVQQQTSKITAMRGIVLWSSFDRDEIMSLMDDPGDALTDTQLERAVTAVRKNVNDHLKAVRG